MNVRYDQSISIGHILSALTFIFGGLAAYYDLKSEVRDLQTVVEYRFKQQKQLDDNQDQRLRDINAGQDEKLREIKRSVEISADEIKGILIGGKSNRN